MVSVTGAISALATFGSNISGIKNSYDLGQIPEKVSIEKLPCLIVVPDATDLGFKTLTFMGNSPEFDFTVTQLLLYSPKQNTEYHKILPGLIAMLDTYLLALKANPFLGSPTAPPVHKAVTVIPSIVDITYAGTLYYGIIFKYSLRIFL